MRLTTILLFLCAIVSAVLPAQAGPVVTFTPSELYDVIDARNASVKLASLITEDSRQGVAVAKSAYLPDVRANWQVGYLGDGYLTDRNFSNGMAVDNPHFVNNFGLEAMTMIYSGGAIKQGIRLAELKTKLSELSLEENRQQVRFVVISKLLDLECLYRQREVITNNIALANQVLDNMSSRHEQGLLLENDITRYQLQIQNLQLQLDRIGESITVLNSSIATALAYENGTEFHLNTDKCDNPNLLQSLDNWQALAKANNLSVSKAKVGLDMGNAKLKLAQADKLPHLSAFAYGQFNAPIVTEVPVINKNFMYWGFGVNLSYSLSSLYKSNKKISQVRTEILENEQQIDLAHDAVTDQVTQAYEAYNTAQSQLRTQQYSLQLANQNYDTVSSRFGEGMALVTDLVDAANVRIAAETGVENARIQMLYCIYKLKFISNTL